MTGIPDLTQRKKVKRYFTKKNLYNKVIKKKCLTK